MQSGVGRTGKWWAHQHFKGAVPDIMLFAKGIASGFPFAGIAAKPEMFHGLAPGSLVTTHSLMSLLHSQSWYNRIDNQMNTKER